MVVVNTKPKKVFTTCRLTRGTPRLGITMFRTNGPLRGEGYPVSKGGVGDYIGYGAYTVVDKFNKTKTFSSKGCGVAGGFNKALCRCVNGRATVSLVGCMSRVGIGFNNRNAGVCSASKARVGGLYVRGGLGLLSTSIHRLKASVGCIILRGLCTGLGSAMRFHFGYRMSSIRAVSNKCHIVAGSNMSRYGGYVISIKEDKDG